MGIFNTFKSAFSNAVSDGVDQTTIGQITFIRINAPEELRNSFKYYYIAEHHITIGEWQKFSEETKYLTDAEIGDDDPNRVLKLENGSIPMEVIDGEWKLSFLHNSTTSNDLSKGWGMGLKDMKAVKIPGASWKNPCFPGEVQLTENHPVVLISQRDAQLYCQWFEDKYSYEGGIERISILDANLMEKLGLVGTLGRATVSNTNFNDKKSGKWFGGTTEYNNFAADEKGFYDMAGNVLAWAYWQKEGEMAQYGTYGASWVNDITTQDFVEKGLRLPFKGNSTVRSNFIGVRVMGYSNEVTLEKRERFERVMGNKR